MKVLIYLDLTYSFKKIKVWFTLRVLFWCLLGCNLKLKFHLIELYVQISRKLLWSV